MLTKTSIISFLMLITFSLGGKGLEEGSVKAEEIRIPRIPPRLQTKNSTFHPFILNGSRARIEDYPFKLSLRVFGDFFCGASVISSQWVLTAAHCLERQISPDLITVYGGSINRLIGGDEFDVDYYELHPDYNSVTLDFDVAVIKIKGSFDGHPIIRPALLANEHCLTLPKMMVRLAGWGYNEHNVLPEKLYEIQQYIIDNEECYERWEGDITSRMLCATVENNVDSCNGDSGTEAITLMHVMNFSIPYKIAQLKLKENELLQKFLKFTRLLNENLFITRGAVLKDCLQVGIISFGSIECGYPIPSVFTRIEDPAIRGFIRKFTGI